MKRGEREASPDESRHLSEERTRLEKQLSIVRSELGRLSGDALDLADFVGGGNGRGTGVKNAGIVLGTGISTVAKRLCWAGLVTPLSELA